MRDAFGQVTKGIAHRVRSYGFFASCGGGCSRDACDLRLVESKSVATEVAPTTAAADL